MHTMNSMVQSRRHNMNEKLYKRMGVTGAGNITIGVISIVTGVVSGILLIISGARLLKKRSDIMF